MATTPTNDAASIAASMSQPAVFAVVFDRHYDAILGYLARRVDRALAEEIASETFVLAFAGRQAYDPAYGNARPWLYGIATNCLRQHARSEHRRRRAFARALEREGQPADALDAVVARVDAATQGRATAEAVGRLRAAERDTLLLYALTELDYEGIAVAMGVPVGTVRSRLHRVRRHLRAVLGDESSAVQHAITKRSDS